MIDPKKLRRTGPWQVLVLDRPDGVDHLDVIGIALVVDARADRIRGASPLTDLAELSDVVLQAATEPPGDCKPARPRSLQCQPGHARALAEAGRRLGCSVQTTRTLKAAETAAALLADHLSPGIMGLPVTDAPWSQLGAQLFADPPWSTLDDGVELHIRSEDGSLDGRVALVLGLAGQQFGFSIFPSAASLDRFRSRPRPSPGSLGLEGIEALLVHFDPPEELPKPLVQAARRAGLVHREAGRFELVQTLLALDGEVMSPMTAVEERAVAGIVEAVLEMWRRRRAALVDEGGEERILLADGRAVVVSVPRRAGCGPLFGDDDPSADDVEEPLLDTYDHVPFTAMGPDGVPVVILKYAKAHALRVAGWIDGIERLVVVAVPGQPVSVFGEAAHKSYGLLLRMDADHPVAEWLASRSPIALIVSSGGAKRPTFHAKNIVFEAQVTVEVVGSVPVDAVRADDEVYDDFDFETLDPDGLLGGKDWSGPPETWPAASATLMAFGAPLELDGAPLEVADVMVRLLTIVWNAVVAADFMGLPDKVELVRTLALPLPVPDAVDRLVARKRKCFPLDNRVISVADVAMDGGELRVRVDWSVAQPGG